MLGKQWIVSFIATNFSLLQEKEKMMEILLGAAEASGATIIVNFFTDLPSQTFYTVIISESHFHLVVFDDPPGECELEIFTCGELDNAAGLEYLISFLRPHRETIRIKEFNRGLEETVRRYCRNNIDSFNHKPPGTSVAPST